MRKASGATGSLRVASALTCAALAATLVGAAPALGHRADLVKPRGAGPIVREETTLGQLRRWFGPPTARRRIRVGCERVIAARWGRRLKVYTTRQRPRTVRAVFVASRRIVSEDHGELSWHTRKGLRIGNGEGRLRRLYPGADFETHGGHTHYRLGTGAHGAYLLAKVVDRRVVRLEAWPFEFC